MSIRYLERLKSFKLDTKNSSYVIHIVDEEEFIIHGYYGSKIGDDDIRYASRLYELPYVPTVNNRDRGTFLDSASFEYPAHGTGDFRETAFEAETEEGYRTFSLLYKGHEIYKGKKSLEGLPACFAKEDEAETLELTAYDKLTGLNVVILYTVFNEYDAITRSVTVKNEGEKSIILKKVMSTCIDMDFEDQELITLHGAWGRERGIVRMGISQGRYSIGSMRGVSSHQQNPFMAVVDRHTTGTYGRAYGFNLVYSGNFTASCEASQYRGLRILMGINPEDFSWKLESKETFYSPEAVMVFSDKGLDHMTHTFHDLYRKHLIRGAYRDVERPVLINNWEGTYFDFDSDKLVSIAKDAAGYGVELFVMDDGWFGKRNDDNTSLGDWYVNEEKIKGGIAKLAEDIRSIKVAGSDKKMQFGLWVEPEMISPDSDLYRAHPEYAILIPGREGTLLRNQYVLDISRREVADHIYDQIHDIIKEAGVSYVKWDMNRQLTDLYSAKLDSESQGELLHRYTLGLYYMQEKLITDFPEILLENCSSGGGRYDPGMLYYSPQIWCSDDTDAIERLSIQEGTALVYPLSTMGAHVSDCPNHMLGRNTPFKTRGNVALLGTFGYELDITKLSKEDRDMIPGQIADYHKNSALIREGDYYRIESFRENHLRDCVEIVSKDKSKALLIYVQVLAAANFHSTRIRPRGLISDCVYEVSAEDDILCLDAHKKSIELTGATIMNAGLNIGPMYGKLRGDFASTLIYIEKKE